MAHAHHIDRSLSDPAANTDGPPGPRWFVTRAILHNGRALVWNIRVETEIGKMARVILSSENALDLEQEHCVPA